MTDWHISHYKMVFIAQRIQFWPEALFGVQKVWSIHDWVERKQSQEKWIDAVKSCTRIGNKGVLLILLYVGLWVSGIGKNLAQKKHKFIHNKSRFNMATMSDKSSWDIFRKWGFLIFVLFYLHLALILWYPLPPSSMLCRCRGLCSRRNRKINIVLGEWGWGEGGKCEQDAQKLNFTTKSLDTFVAHCSHVL